MESGKFRKNALAHLGDEKREEGQPWRGAGQREEVDLFCRALAESPQGRGSLAAARPSGPRPSCEGSKIQLTKK